MTHHALEIVLTRPLPPQALRRAARVIPVAASHYATHLMALVYAKTPYRAAHQLRRRLDDLLPIDVITTHYPDADHKIQLNVAFPSATHAVLKAQANRAAQTPERFLELTLHRALAEHTDREIDYLSQTLRRMLAHTTPAYLLSAVGHTLTQLPESPAS